MKQIVTDLYNSFSNGSDGFSAKKLTAFILTMTYCYAHRFVDETNLIGVLGVDAGLIAVLFGVNVIDKMKNPTENNNNENQL